MIQEIDFQDFDVNGNGFDNEVRLGRIHRERLPRIITGGAPIIGASKTAVFEDEEPSWLQSITDVIDESGKSVDEMIEPFKEPVSRLLDLLGLPNGLYRFALAFLRDTLDPKVDWSMTDNSDRYRWMLRYPRLTRLAKINHDDFELFAKKLRVFVTMPDITKPS